MRMAKRIAPVFKNLSILAPIKNSVTQRSKSKKKKFEIDFR
jgi:hypothetical protein